MLKLRQVLNGFQPSHESCPSMISSSMPSCQSMCCCQGYHHNTMYMCTNIATVRLYIAVVPSMPVLVSALKQVISCSSNQNAPASRVNISLLLLCMTLSVWHTIQHWLWYCTAASIWPLMIGMSHDMWNQLLWLSGNPGTEMEQLAHSGQKTALSRTEIVCIFFYNILPLFSTPPTFPQSPRPCKFSITWNPKP